MRKPLIHLHSDLDAAASEGVIVTGTRRQARELKYAYDHQKLKDKKTSWKSARILPVKTWLQHCYESFPTELKTQTILPQNSSLIIAEGSAPLDIVRSHTAQFMEAWDLCWETNLWRDRSEIGQTENGKLFLRWADAFQKNLKNNSSITVNELPLRIISALKQGWVPPHSICLFGLSHTTPCLSELFKLLSLQGLTKTYETRIRPAAKTSDIIEFGTTDQEILGATIWARNALSNNPHDCRIGIVVDDIEKNYGSIRRQIGSAFPDITNLDEIVNIGSGQPLLTESLCTDTLDFLDWFKCPQDYRKLEKWSNRPYFCKLALPKQLSHTLPERLTLNELAKLSNNKQLLELMHKFEASDLSNITNGIQLVVDLLDMAGWNEISSDSEYFQVREQILDVLAETASMNFLKHTTWEDLVSTIRTTADSRSSAPKTTFAPIQIIGRHDLSELEFDLLWVSGMSDSSWPGRNRPNIFIPNRIQGRVETLAATPNSWLKHTSEITQNWRTSTGKLQFSYALRDGENDSRPSILVPFNKIAQPSKVLPNTNLISFGHPWIQNTGMNATERFVDDFGSIVPINQTLRGGSSLIRNQTLCAFRGWAKHRLDLKERLSPHRFPSLLDRGNMVHNLLHELTKGKESKLDIANITDKEVDEALNQILTSFNTIPPVTLAQEKKRFKKIITTWIDAETARPDYTIEDVEQEREIQLAELHIKIRLDRIDRINDGSVIIIDYKTGSSTLTSWKPPRMSEPQLPLYAISDDEVNAIAFMSISDDSVRLRGLGDPAIEDKNIYSPQFFNEESFISLKNVWHESLLKTSSEFMAGYAKVEPLDPNKTCRQCDLQSLCRIYALHQPKHNHAR